MTTSKFCCLALICLAWTLDPSQVPLAAAPDPVTMDPEAVDAQFPAALAEISIDSHGSRLNAILYRAQGRGPHPTVVLLHGFPGNERNLDLAQAMRRAGFNVLFFHYRGAWGSGGAFSFSNGLEDVAVALDFLRQKENVARYRIDAEKLSLVGHSMGGFMALMTTSADSSVRCTVSIAGANMGWLGGLAGSSPEAANSVALAMAGGLGPLRGTSGEALRDDLREHADAFDLVKRASALGGRELLLIGGERDSVVPLAIHHHPLVQALKAADSSGLSEQVLDSDHAFSDRRIALARAVVSWLSRSCR